MPMRRIDQGPCSEDWRVRECRDPDHAPPSMLYIPPGELWEHECPSCHRKTLMRGSGVTL